MYVQPKTQSNILKKKITKIKTKSRPNLHPLLKTLIPYTILCVF